MSTADCQALTDFFHKTGGTNWVKKTLWLQDSDCCQWQGVGCDDQRVTTLCVLACVDGDAGAL